MYCRLLFLFALLLHSGITGVAQIKTNSSDSSSLSTVPPLHADRIYKPDLLFVIPLQFTESGLGIGTGFERVIDRNGIVALSIPLFVTFNLANTNRIYDYNTGNYSTGTTDAMFYTMPGIKFYPTGSYGRLKYATGASFVIASGQKSEYFATYNGLNETELVQHHFLTGIIWQNSLNLNMDTHLYLGAEMGIGGTLTNNLTGKKTGNETLVQGSLRIGYRF